MSNPQSTFQHTRFHSPSVLSRRRKTIASVTIQTQLAQLRSTGRYDCFKLEWKRIYEDKSSWPVPPHLFWDSDLAKWIEGACYFLHDPEHYDEEVDAAIREIVGWLRTAQQSDGYLNLHYTRVDPGGRWSNLQDMHELYNAGHLIEAAIAHRNYYGNEELMEPLLRYVALMRREFGDGPGQRRGYPGHPEIELALMRLHKTDRSPQDAYGLARFFLEERGNPTGSQDGTHYYLWEAARRGEGDVWKRPNSHPVQRDQTLWYCQAHKPILEQISVEGHSVRAMYLLTAVADMLCIDKDSKAKDAADDDDKWMTALTHLWDNMVDRKMYLTGGIGAIKQWEGFGPDYFLPQGTDEGGCYAETCASIGVMFLAERLLALDLDGRYADVMELCLYNGVMTAMSLDGRAFTYVNQLASSKADLSRREDWFECSCCPPNLTRLFGSLGGYLWHFDTKSTEKEAAVDINVFMYTTAQLTIPVGEDGKSTITLEQETNYPWEGHVRFRLSSSSPNQIRTTIRLRIPAWCEGLYKLVPPLPSQPPLSKSFLELPPSYTTANPTFELHLDNLTSRYIAPHPNTTGGQANTLALARGPIVYCVEDVDNPWEEDHFRLVGLREGTAVIEDAAAECAGEPYVALRTRGWTRSAPQGGKEEDARWTPAMPTRPRPLDEERELVFVPYYLRANRGGKGHMRVGLLRA
jgi:uncharacterized protein